MSAAPVSPPSPSPAIQSPAAPRTYRFSTLFTGLGRMWRAWRITLPIIVVNALVQGLLILPTQSAYSLWTLTVTALASAVVLLATFGVMVAAALESHPPARPTWEHVRERLAAAWLPFAGWTAALFVVTAIGLAFWTWPGMIVLAIGLFVPLCALDRTSPVSSSWKIMRQRPLRWLITVVLILAMGSLAFLLTAVLWFFVPLYVGVALGCLFWGLLVWWWSTSLAALYLDVVRRSD